MWELCANRHAIWGGCLVDGHEPQWACGSCHRNWGEPREASSYYCNLCGRPSSQIWCSECCARNEEESTRLFSEAFKEFERQEAEREVSRRGATWAAPRPRVQVPGRLPSNEVLPSIRHGGRSPPPTRGRPHANARRSCQMFQTTRIEMR